MYEGKIEDDLIIITKQTMDEFLKLKEPAECVALYCFYYYTAKGQKTNQPHATNKYVKKGLKWGEDKIKRILEQLIEVGLVNKVVKRDEKGKIKGYYIKLNYMFKKDTITQLIHSSQMPEQANATSGFQDTNALSANNLNALNANMLNALSVATDDKPLEVIVQDTPEYIIRGGEKIKMSEYIRELIGYWSPICTKMDKLYSWKCYKDALKELINKAPEKQLGYVVNHLSELNKEKFCRSVITPIELNTNWDSVVSFISKEDNKKGKRGVSIAF